MVSWVFHWHIDQAHRCYACSSSHKHIPHIFESLGLPIVIMESDISNAFNVHLLTDNHSHFTKIMSHHVHKESRVIANIHGCQRIHHPL
ncbi:hypothetical protein SLEP1_g54897 [Rubroshorea leprosula]|uniref:Uncharacterized protein n=1 Tax=Rubroshorea leprosula TaxID=152421 RepID=A0AAV5MF05_9ROSI|nr:hypothetical protein SLEP1_g54897 [Rubroshorea leprosula]